jgi:hypothetical protein
MTPGMAAVHRAQSLVEFQLVGVCMPLGTKPFTQALHHLVSLLIYLLLAARATLVKEPYEAIP